jgi:hypothetical protein
MLAVSAKEAKLNEKMYSQDLIYFVRVKFSGGRSLFVKCLTHINNPIVTKL